MLNKIIDMKTRTLAKPIYLICKQVKTKKKMEQVGIPMYHFKPLNFRINLFL